MADLLTFNDVARAETAGMWAGVVQGVMPTDPEEMQYFVERTTSGLWAISLKGYNDGEPLPVVGAPGYGFIIGSSKTEKHQVVSVHSTFLHVPEDETDAFHEAIYEPEARMNLLVQALETDEPGIWSILEPMSPDPKNHEYRLSNLGLLLRDEDGRIGLGQGYWQACATNKRNNKPRLHVTDAEPALLVTHGAQLSLLAAGVIKLRKSSIAERTKPTNPFEAHYIDSWCGLNVDEANEALAAAYDCSPRE